MSARLTEAAHLAARCDVTDAHHAIGIDEIERSQDDRVDQSEYGRRRAKTY